jgi:hypothetical protein
MKQALSLFAAVATLALAAPAAQAVEYRNLEDFALATFDTCAKVIGEGAAPDAAFTAMGYGPGPRPETWIVEAEGWASMVAVHSETLKDGRNYRQCVTTFAPQPTDQIAFNAAFLSRVVANGVGVSGRVTQDGPRTITSYVDAQRGLVLNLGATAAQTPDETATTSLTYSVIRP